MEFREGAFSCRSNHNLAPQATVSCPQVLATQSELSPLPQRVQAIPGMHFNWCTLPVEIHLTLLSLKE